MTLSAPGRRSSPLTLPAPRATTQPTGALRKFSPGPASAIWVDGKAVVEPSRIDQCFRSVWRAIYDGLPREHCDI
eukprot:11205573-Lingulodinium_polyedra.AAC.1